MPQLELMWLPMDHLTAARPGKCTPDACMADNDLALGRIVQALSRSPYWKDTAIFVVDIEHSRPILKECNGLNSTIEKSRRLTLDLSGRIMQHFRRTPMKRFPQSPKKPNLSESIGRHLDMYALAASAAGVGVMALAQPAEGKIVFTPANVPIVGTVNIDLNHDGVADFAIKVNVYAGAYVAAHSLGQNRVWGAGKSASALLAGVRVRPNPVKFQKGPVCSFLSVTSGPCKDMLTCRNFSGSTQCKGPFAATTTAFLGLKFHIKEEIHFGWARLKFSKNGLVLTGYAYETVPKMPIITGKTKGSNHYTANSNSLSHPDGPGSASLTSLIPDKRRPATLGALAMGAPGLSIWRRDELVQETN
jgi:hypothetical protein